MKSRAAFAFIFVTVLLDMLALGILVPVLPKLIVQFEGGDMAKAASINGWFGLTWAAMQLVFAPLVGALSDRVGRRPVVLLSNFGLGLDYLVMAVAPSASWLFVGRVISGITSASFPTASAYIADVTPEDQRAAKFGMLGAAFGLGFIAGPAVGGLLGQIDLRLPFWVAAGLSLANACYGLFVLPESLPKDKRAAFDLTKANPIGSLTLLRAGGWRGLGGLASAAFLYFLAHESLPSMFVLYTDYRYRWSERRIGLVLAAVGVGSTIVSAGLVGLLVKKLGERATMLVGLACMCGGFFAFALAPDGDVFLVGIPLLSLGGLASPPMQALLSARLGASEQGRLQGALGSMRGITGMIGPVLFTQVFAMTLDRAAGTTYGIAAALVGAGALVGFTVTRARPAVDARTEREPSS